MPADPNLNDAVASCLQSVGLARVVHARTTWSMSSPCSWTWRMGMWGLSSIRVCSQSVRVRGCLSVPKEDAVEVDASNGWCPGVSRPCCPDGERQPKQTRDYP